MVEGNFFIAAVFLTNIFPCGILFIWRVLVKGLFMLEWMGPVIQVDTNWHGNTLLLAYFQVQKHAIRHTIKIGNNHSMKCFPYLSLSPNKSQLLLRPKQKSCEVTLLLEKNCAHNTDVSWLGTNRNSFANSPWWLAKICYVLENKYPRILAWCKEKATAFADDFYMMRNLRLTISWLIVSGAGTPWRS